MKTRFRAILGLGAALLALPAVSWAAAAAAQACSCCCPLCCR